MRRVIRIGIVIILMIIGILALSSCADTSHVQECLPETEHTYGFWGGTWHGMIMVPSFIGSLIWDDVSVYAVNNNGGWYDFGYVGGLFLTLKLFRINVKNKK
jgi:hypothetical protein